MERFFTEWDERALSRYYQEQYTMDTRLDPIVPPAPIEDATTQTGMDVEPAKIVGLVQALLVLLVAFGVAISPDQMDAVLKFVTALIAVLGIIGVGTFFTRLNVFPAASVNKLTAKAFEAGQKSGPPHL